MPPAIVCTVLSLCCLLAGYVDRATGGHRPLFALSIVVVGPMLRGSLDPIILDTFGPIFRTIRSRLPQQTQTGSPVPGKRTALPLKISPCPRGWTLPQSGPAHHATTACLRLVGPDRIPRRARPPPGIGPALAGWPIPHGINVRWMSGSRAMDGATAQAVTAPVLEP